MKRLFLSCVVALAGLGFAAHDADARRFGGGGTSGMQRSLPARPAQTPTPPHQQAPTQPSAVPGQGAAAAGSMAAAPRRSWMAPVAGLAAGLGLAALASHLGFGEGLANIMTIALLAIVAFAVIRWLMARSAAGRAGQNMPGTLRYQGASAGGASPGYPGAYAQPGSPSAAAFGGSSGAGSAAPASSDQSYAVPPGFDVAAFERIAKMIFIRMQAANDAGDLADLRQFTTPEMFASVRLDLQERGNARQQTDVVQLATEVLDIARENGNQVVSVRFHGLIREEIGGSAQPFDEVWHLVKPEDGSHEWAIAGIAQYESQHA